MHDQQSAYELLSSLFVPGRNEIHSVQVGGDRGQHWIGRVTFKSGEQWVIKRETPPPPR